MPPSRVFVFYLSNFFVCLLLAPCRSAFFTRPIRVLSEQNWVYPKLFSAILTDLFFREKSRNFLFLVTYVATFNVSTEIVQRFFVTYSAIPTKTSTTRYKTLLFYLFICVTCCNAFIENTCFYSTPVNIFMSIYAIYPNLFLSVDNGIMFCRRHLSNTTRFERHMCK